VSSVHLDRISKAYGERTVIKDLELQVNDGEFVTLLGPSGCGKTTTLRMIAGYIYPDSGSITVSGEDVTEQSPQKRRFGMVFQNYALFPHMTAAGNIAFGLRMQGKRGDAVRRQVEKMLALVGLEQLSNSYPHELSGGQQQRIALARALAFEPRILLMDEPLSALDLKLRQRMQLEVKRIQQEVGITTIYVTHDQEEALSLSDRVAVMDAGRIVQVGSPREVYQHPITRFVADFVGRINLLEAEVLEVRPPAVVCRPAGTDRVLVCAPPDAEQWRGSRPVTLGLRPEHVQLAPAPSAAQELSNDGLIGVVEKVTYLGGYQLAHVQVAPGLTVLAADPQAQFGMGAPVHLSWPADRICVLRDH